MLIIWRGKRQGADAHDAGPCFCIGSDQTAFITSSIPLEGRQLSRRVAKRDKGLMLMMLIHTFRRTQHSSQATHTRGTESLLARKAQVADARRGPIVPLAEGANATQKPQRADAHDACPQLLPDIQQLSQWERKAASHKWHGQQKEAGAHHAARKAIRS